MCNPFLDVNLKFPKALKWVKSEYHETAGEIEPRNKHFLKIKFVGLPLWQSL